MYLHKCRKCRIELFDFDGYTVGRIYPLPRKGFEKDRAAWVAPRIFSRCYECGRLAFGMEIY